MAGMAAGEAYTPLRPGWRGNSDLDVTNNNNQKSLAGGWYTGPGLSKFTYPQVCSNTSSPRVMCIAALQYPFLSCLLRMLLDFLLLQS